jgi:hypothetical protein
MRDATGLLLVASAAAYGLHSVSPHGSSHLHLAIDTRRHPAPRAKAGPISKLYGSPPRPPAMAPPPLDLPGDTLASASPPSPAAESHAPSQSWFANPFAAGGFLSPPPAPAHPALTPEEARLAALREKASALKEAIATAEEEAAEGEEEEEEEEEQGSGLRRYHLAMQEGWRAGDEVTVRIPGGGTVVLQLPSNAVLEGKTIAFSLPRARGRAAGAGAAQNLAEGGGAGVSRVGVAMPTDGAGAMSPRPPATPQPPQPVGPPLGQLPPPSPETAGALRQGSSRGHVVGVGSGGGLRARLRRAAAAVVSRGARGARSAARVLRRGEGRASS